MAITLRQVSRTLSRHPGFAAATVLTLALGIGATALVFGVVDNVLLQPLPYPGSERLVRVFHQAPGLGFGDDLGLSDATYFRLREGGVLADLALYDPAAVNLSGPAGEPERVAAARVSHSLFSVLGVAPVLGRAFSEAEERPGAPPVVLLGERLWRRSFAGRAGILGEAALIDGRPHEVVGIVPAGVRFPERDTELWLPRALDPSATNIGSLGIDGVGRLRAGISPEQAEAALSARLEPLAAHFPVEQGSQLLTDAGFATRVVSLREGIVGDLSRSLWVLMGGMALVLLIACANVANLFLVRAEGREQELAVRAALGAEWRHLARAFLVEGLALGLAGAATGAALAHLGMRALVRFGPQRLPRIDEVALDARGVAFTLAVGLAAGLAVAIVPLMGRGGDKLAAGLGGGRRGTTARPTQARSRDLLMASQVALAVVLLVGSGLMVRSYRSLSQVDPGFDPRWLLTFDVALPPAEYPGDEAPAAFVRRALEALAALPGVEAASAVNALPLRVERLDASGVSLEDFPDGPSDPPKIHFDSQVGPGYFATLGIPVLEGRAFSPADHERRSGAVVVNRAFARRYWPAESAVGKRLQPREGTPEESGWYTIVGVVADVSTIRLDEPASAMIYFPLLALPANRGAFEARDMTLVVRTAGAPGALAGPARDRIHQLDPHLPVSAVETMERVVTRATARPAFIMAVLAIGAAGALLIGAVGIYGVVSHQVGRRRRELGIRLAVGARPGEIARMVLRRCLWVTAAGAAAGILAAASLTRLMRALLFGVDPLDAATFAVVVPALVAVALLAAYLPARRAARIDPLTSLRAE